MSVPDIIRTGVLLRTDGVLVPDYPPPFPYALAHWPNMARTFEPYIATGLSDREAWAALFTDQRRIELFQDGARQPQGEVHAEETTVAVRRRMIVDLFAGPGGWDEGLRSIGLEVVGIELDPAACATRAAAGYLTIRADVASYPPEPFGGVTGLIASPPCTDFSRTGKRKGLEGDTGRLVYEVMRWASLRPEWIACEQVPDVLPVWKQFRDELRAMGYEAWCGVLDCADYGVPQNRKRAFLLASRIGPAHPPEPTHAQNPRGTGLFGGERRRWVSMAEALGWDGEVQTAQNLGGTNGNYYTRSTDEPSPTVMSNCRSWKRWWCFERPSTTVMGDCRIAPPGHHSGPMFTNAVKVELHETAVLQGFPPDYPFQGNKTQRAQQIGNAVPPPMAAALVGELTRHARRKSRMRR